MLNRFRAIQNRKAHLILVSQLWCFVVMAQSRILQDEGLANEYSKSIADFTIDLHKEFAQPGQNLFFSPFSISTALSMVQLGASSNTLEQMSKVLHAKHLGDKLYQAKEAYVGYLNKGNSNFSLHTANRIYPSSKFQPIKSFLDQCSKHFHATIEPADFTQGEKVRSEINDWVESQTNSKIKNLLPEGSLTPLTVMVLVNAIYFKGNWASQFDPKRTEQMEFHTGSESVLVDMMYQKQEVKHMYNPDLQCNAIKLMYQGNSLSMLLVLPDAVDGLTELEGKIDSSFLNAVSSEMVKRKVDIWLPKFKLESSFDLSTNLKSLGMTDAFDRDKADFSGIDVQKSIYIDEVYHKAFVEVNEEGTEAAAATAIKMVKRSIQILPQFRADHPFLFYIMDEDTNVILFAGRLVNPESQSKNKDEL